MQGAQLEVGEPSNKRTGKKRKSPSNNLPLSKDREVLGPDDSFDHYCQPTELYNYIRHRAKENPSFLNRCLNYRIKARNKRIKMRVSLSLRIKEKESVSPLYICLGRQSQNNKDVEKQHAYADYQVSGLFKFQSSSEIDGDAVNAKFKLPEVYKFAEEAQSGSLYILVFTIVKNGYSSYEANAALVPSDESMPRDFCLCGKASLEFLYATWDTDPSFISRQIAETAVTIDLAPHYIKREGKDWRLSIEGPTNSDIERLPMLVSAEEYGARERPPCLHYSSRDILSPDLATTMRLRERSVYFNFRYHDNKLIKTEATNDFSCPVCMIRCGSYKGVRYHMESFHDFFNYEYWADQVVNVTIKPEVLEVIKSGPKSRFSLYQIVGDLSPRQIFLLRNARLCKRQFYHSVTYQPMSIEEVVSGDDSESEIDEETKDIEHRKLFDDCEGVTKEGREIMFMWSTFVRRQRVVSDCHIPWACKTFTKLHANVFVQSFQMNLCWRMLMIKLWKHNLIDGKVMNDCSIILEEYLKQNSPSPS